MCIRCAYALFNIHAYLDEHIIKCCEILYVPIYIYVVHYRIGVWIILCGLCSDTYTYNAYKVIRMKVFLRISIQDIMYNISAPVEFITFTFSLPPINE